MTIEERFIHKIEGGLANFNKTSTGYKFQCPSCQHGSRDSKGRPYSLGRLKGNFYHHNRSVKFRCFSCGTHQEFFNFLEQWFPPLHLEYQQQRDALGLTGFQTNCPSLKTTLKKQKILNSIPPRFNANQKPPTVPQGHGNQQSPMKQVLQPVTPQQQAGLGSALDQQHRQTRQRGLNHQADLWLSTDVWRSDNA